jgi:hypothetical protein
VGEDEKKLGLLEPVGVLRVIEDVEERPAGAELHDDDLAAPVDLLLDRQKLDDVLVLDLLEDLELADLDFGRAEVADLVERLDCHGFAIVLEKTIN